MRVGRGRPDDARRDKEREVGDVPERVKDPEPLPRERHDVLREVEEAVAARARARVG